jgi:hypothetical protein
MRRLNLRVRCAHDEGVIGAQTREVGYDQPTTNERGIRNALLGGDYYPVGSRISREVAQESDGWRNTLGIVLGIILLY